VEDRTGNGSKRKSTSKQWCSMTPFLLPNPSVNGVAEYLASGGGQGLQRAVDIGPGATIDEITRAGLRGRGGAGFPTGRKWASVLAEPGTHRYVVVNGAEGEPGTFKDRALLRANPYQLVEGAIIAAYAIGAIEIFVAVKEAFAVERDRVTRAVQELQQAGVCTDCPITIVAGPDEYLYGEEKALLEVIEGKPPLPRLLPPHEHGLFATAPQTGWEPSDVEPGHIGVHASNPTLVNNVETLSNVPHIMARGADWFRSMGTPASPGTHVCTVVGDVVTPGVAEIELGTPLRAVLAMVGGGTRPGRQVKAVFSGVANPVVTSQQLDVPLTYEGFKAIGAGMGACGFIVYDDSACMVEVAREFSRFLYVESCGQCPPCKLGCGEITSHLERIQMGRGDRSDLGEIDAWLSKVTDGNRCYLPIEAQTMVSSVLRAFPADVADHLNGRQCPRPRSIVVPKLLDLHDGVATYDTRHVRKQPDWTLGPDTKHSGDA